jgi:hypothetical protein
VVERQVSQLPRVMHNCGKRKRGGVHELVRTNNAVLISAIGALLDEVRIPYFVLDQNMSVLEGSIGILPRRLMVAEAHAEAARTLLANAGLAAELRPHGRQG